MDMILKVSKHSKHIWLYSGRAAGFSSGVFRTTSLKQTTIKPRAYFGICWNHLRHVFRSSSRRPCDFVAWIKDHFQPGAVMSPQSVIYIKLNCQVAHFDNFSFSGALFTCQTIITQPNLYVVTCMYNTISSAGNSQQDGNLCRIMSHNNLLTQV